MAAKRRLLGVDPGTKRIGLALSDELGLLASPLDRRLAALAGTAAVEAWVQGFTDVMPALRLEGGEWGTACLPLGEVVGRERTLPPEYMDVEGYDVTEACRQYIAPLIGGPPPAPLLWIE